ncbi:MAG TPA: HlyD family efflux transporter periplasmic adaptor subunit [Terriglobales bacterium]
MKRRIAVVIIAAAVVLITLGTYGFFHRGPVQLTASGTLEARNINVGSKVGGRIMEVAAHEGDHVNAGQLLVRFDDAELEAALLQARGTLAQARANYEKMQRGSRPEEIAEARAASGPGGYRVEQLAQAQAELERAKADARNAELSYQRTAKLADEGVAARQLLDDAEARYKTAQAAVASMQSNVAAAQGQLSAAKAVQQRTERGFRKEEIAAAKADVLRAEGELKQAEARWAEREVRAPSNASVEVMDLRPGDLLPANAVVARLLESDQLFVMVYVPESKIGQVQVGQKAEVKVDAFPQWFPAVVEQIRQKAEFLPRNVQTADERVHQVIGVKLRVDNSSGKLRAGIAADVRFAGGAQ